MKSLVAELEKYKKLAEKHNENIRKLRYGHLLDRALSGGGIIPPKSDDPN